MPAAPADALSPSTTAETAATKANLTPVICSPPVGDVSLACRSGRLSALQLAVSQDARGERNDRPSGRRSGRTTSSARTPRDKTDHARGDEAAAVGDACDARDAACRVGPMRPAAANTSGMTRATPMPSSANAARPKAGQEPERPHGPDRGAYSREADRRTGPSLLITRSPTSLTGPSWLRTPRPQRPRWWQTRRARPGYRAPTSRFRRAPRKRAETDQADHEHRPRRERE